MKKWCDCLDKSEITLFINRTQFNEDVRKYTV